MTGLVEEMIQETICPMCRRLNPQHKDCNSCEEIEGYRKRAAEKKTKSLAELCEKNLCMCSILPPIEDVKVWHIEIKKRGLRKDFESKTHAECKKKAIEYLEAL